MANDCREGNLMADVLHIAMIVLSVTMVVVVLLQVKSATLGSAFGSSDTSVFSTRRGFDKVLFNFTIVLGALFIILSLVILIVTD